MNIDNEDKLNGACLIGLGILNTVDAFRKERPRLLRNLPVIEMLTEPIERIADNISTRTRTDLLAILTKCK